MGLISLHKGSEELYRFIGLLNPLTSSTCLMSDKIVNMPETLGNTFCEKNRYVIFIAQLGLRNVSLYILKYKLLLPYWFHILERRNLSECMTTLQPTNKMHTPTFATFVIHLSLRFIATELFQPRDSCHHSTGFLDESQASSDPNAVVSLVSLNR